MDRFGTTIGLILGVVFVLTGILWPDDMSNYYVMQTKQFEVSIAELQKNNRPFSEINELKQEFEDFKNSFWGAIFRFLDFKSFLIVFGGSYASTLVAFPFAKALRAIVFILQIFQRSKIQEDFRDVYDTVLVLAEKRVNNELITDEEIAAVKHEKLRQWLQDFIAVDLVNESMISEIIRSEIEAYNYQSFEEIDVLEFLGKSAPAFGMVGTVVGLILMLGRAGGAGGSISDVMGAMSVALITTLYGVLAAQIVYVPSATKRYQTKETNIRLLKMIQESILYLKRREIPEVAAQDLIIYLPPKMRDEITEQKLSALREGNIDL